MGLESVELVLAIEERFLISISDKDAEQVLTVGHLIDLVVRLREEQHCSQTSDTSAPQSRDHIAAVVREIIVDQLGVKPEQVTETARFIEDLDMD